MTPYGNSDTLVLDPTRRLAPPRFEQHFSVGVGFSVPRFAGFFPTLCPPQEFRFLILVLPPAGEAMVFPP